MTDKNELPDGTLSKSTAKRVEALDASGVDNCEDCQIHRQAHHEIDAVVMGAGVFEVLYEGGVEPAWKNTIEAVKKLANHQPSADAVRELVKRAYEVVHHDDECPAIGGNGDKDCQCDAVPFLRELESLLSGGSNA